MHLDTIIENVRRANEKGKKMKKILTILTVFILSFTVYQPVTAQSIDLDNLFWTVEILIDQSETVFGNPQSVRPRDNRGLAISPDGRYLYAGYNNSLSSGGEVRRIDLDLSGSFGPDDPNRNIHPFDSRIINVRGKSIAVDDVGRVYLAEGASIEIYDSNLSINLYTVSGLTNSEGVAVTREQGQLVMYNSDRDDGTLQKRIMVENGNGISGAVLDSNFDGDGTLDLGAISLRGVEIDDVGRIWVAGYGDDTLYRISADGITIDSATVSKPIDIGFDGQTALVTRYTDRLISRIDTETFASVGDDITVPWDDLTLDPNGQCTYECGALSGIVVIPDVGFYVANEAGQTLPFDDIVTGELNVDDNDPILWASNDLQGDYNSDGDVNLVDYTIFVNSWLYPQCNASNGFCNGRDIDRNGRIDLNDFSLMASSSGANP